MKNTYIIAIKSKETLEPIYIKQRHQEDITWIGRDYYRAYIFDSKQDADRVRLDRYKTYQRKEEIKRK